MAWWFLIFYIFSIQCLHMVMIQINSTPTFLITIAHQYNSTILMTLSFSFIYKFSILIYKNTFNILMKCTSILLLILEVQCSMVQMDHIFLNTINQEGHAPCKIFKGLIILMKQLRCIWKHSTQFACSICMMIIFILIQNKSKQKK